MLVQASGSAINEQMSLLELRERLAAAQQREREEVSRLMTHVVDNVSFFWAREPCVKRVRAAAATSSSEHVLYGLNRLPGPGNCQQREKQLLKSRICL
jgi:hypothetical protein